MREIGFTILENKPITDDIYKMVLECSAGEHGITAPGQFINIKIDGLFLRRPISICDWTETTVTVIYKVVGKGTELLKTYEPGRQLNALSALGNGFAPARARETTAPHRRRRRCASPVWTLQKLDRSGSTADRDPRVQHRTRGVLQGGIREAGR